MNEEAGDGGGLERYLINSEGRLFKRQQQHRD